MKTRDSASETLYLFDDLTDTSDRGQMVLRDMISSEPQDGAPAVPFDLIQMLQLALVTGDDELMKQYLDRLTAYPKTLDSLTSQKTAECTLSAVVPLYAMAAISCGASDAKAYALCSAILRRIYEASSLDEVKTVSREAAFQFLQLVNEARDAQSSSAHIRLCKSYVFNHLNQPLTPAIIGKATGLNKNYLMGLFMQEEGVSLMQFVKQERLKAAALLLKCSSYGVAEIASEFKFKSPSHFSSEFRKVFHLSPTKYRKMYADLTA